MLVPRCVSVRNPSGYGMPRDLPRPERQAAFDGVMVDTRGYLWVERRQALGGRSPVIGSPNLSLKQPSLKDKPCCN